MAFAGETEFNGSTRFEIRRRLGGGGMGVVYEAFDRERGEAIALKTLREVDPQNLFRLKNEFRALQDLEHPNLINLGELFFENNHWFFTMELIRGESFTTWVRPRARREVPVSGMDATAHGPSVDHEIVQVETASKDVAFDISRLRGCLAQLVLGLSSLHHAGMVHRDIKPSNILIDAQTGRLVILDFSLIAEKEAHDSITEANSMVGTVSYMAPEQSLGKAVDAAADWYAVGVLLYESLTGQLPFAGNSLEVIAAKQKRHPRSPRSLVPEVPEDLDRLCMMLLEPDPARRPKGGEIRTLLRITDVHGELPRGAAPQMSMERPQFVGRTRELGQLHRAAVKSREDSVTVVVSGESGVGKSALVRYFADEVVARDVGTWMFHGRCYERESVPYKAFDGIIDSLSVRLSKLPDEEAARFLPKDASLLTRLFPVLRRVPVMLRASQKPMALPDATQIRVRAFDALRELFTRISSERPLVLLMDDMQWADTDSLMLLGELLRPPEEPRLLLLCTIRSGPEGKEVVAQLEAVLAQLQDVRRINLESLSTQEAETLVKSLSRRTLGDRAIDFATVAREARGHPLYIHELMHHIASEGGEVPAAIRLDEALWSRISRIEGNAWRVLRAVCVTGAPIEQETTASACEMDLSEFTKHVGVLRVAHLVRTTGMRGTDLIEVYHDRVREAVLSHLGQDELEDFHRKIADALEVAGAENRDPQALLRHLMAAGESSRASYLAEKAARRTMEALAFEQAAEFYRIALGLGNQDVNDRRALLLGLGEALGNAGHGPEAAEAYLEAKEGADPVTRLDCQRKAADHLLSSGHIERGMEILKAVLADVGVELPPTPRKALLSLIEKKVRIAIRGERFTRRDAADISPADFILLDVYETVALNMAMIDNIIGSDFEHRAYLHSLKLGEPKRVAKSLCWHGMWGGAVGKGPRERGRRLVTLARQLQSELNDPYLEALLSCADSLYAYFSGSFYEAIAKFEVTERVLSDHTAYARWEFNNVRVFRCICMRYVGRYAELKRESERLLRDASQRGDNYMRTILKRSLNILWLVGDEPARARQELDDVSWTPAGEGAYHLQHWYDLRARAEIALYEGTTAALLESSKSAFDALHSSMLLRIQTVRADELYLEGRLLLASLDGPKPPDKALSRVLGVAKKLEKEGFHYSWLQAQLFRAAVAVRSGDRAAAIAYLRKVTEDTSNMMQIGAAVAKRHLGRIIGGEEGAYLVAEGDELMVAEGVQDPERLSTLIAPGFPRPA